MRPRATLSHSLSLTLSLSLSLTCSLVPFRVPRYCGVPHTVFMNEPSPMIRDNPKSEILITISPSTSFKRMFSGYIRRHASEPLRSAWLRAMTVTHAHARISIP